MCLSMYGDMIQESKKERIFIYPFHAINIKQYENSMYIIHTVEYFVFPRGKDTCTVHHGGVLERPTRGYVIASCLARNFISGNGRVGLV